MILVTVVATAGAVEASTASAVVIIVVELTLSLTGLLWRPELLLNRQLPIGGAALVSGFQAACAFSERLTASDVQKHHVGCFLVRTDRTLLISDFVHQGHTCNNSTSNAHFFSKLRFFLSILMKFQSLQGCHIVYTI